MNHGNPIKIPLKSSVVLDLPNAHPIIGDQEAKTPADKDGRA
jgi:hypothetical protein